MPMLPWRSWRLLKPANWAASTPRQGGSSETPGSGSRRSWRSQPNSGGSSIRPTPSKASTTNSGRSSRTAVTSPTTRPSSNSSGWQSATSKTNEPGSVKKQGGSEPLEKRNNQPPANSFKVPLQPTGSKPSPNSPSPTPRGSTPTSNH